VERLMNDALRQTIEQINARLGALLEEARRALRGESEFDERDVRRLREPIEGMIPIVAQAPELRRLQPEVAAQLDVYKSRLGELQTTLQQIRVMLLTQQANVNAKQTHISAVSHWATAFLQTR
jgi:chromosome segregation ATPase